MPDLEEQLRFKPVDQGADDEFLFTLYSSTRDDLSLFSEGPLEGLLRMQFKAQTEAYTVQYPGAQHDIVLLNDLPVGRMIVQRTDPEIVFVDLAILPEYRGLGIGTSIIRERMKEAADTGRVLSFHAMKSNRAIGLYLRLGCEIVADEGACFRFAWRPNGRIPI